MCVVRTFKIYSLSKYQVCDIVLLIIVTNLYLRSLQGIYFISENLYCLSNISFHPPPASDNRHSILCFYEFNMFRFNMWVRSYSICFSLPDFFHLAYPSGPSMLSKCQDFFFFVAKKCSIIFIHLSVDGRLVCFLVCFHLTCLFFAFLTCANFGIIPKNPLPRAMLKRIFLVFFFFPHGFYRFRLYLSLQSVWS